MIRARARVIDEPARPRWGGLYAIVLSATVTLVLVHLVAPLPVLETLLSLGVVAGAFGAMARWVASNRAAIDQVDWCACAPSTVTVREIRGRSVDVANGDRPGLTPGVANEPTPRVRRDAEPAVASSALEQVGHVGHDRVVSKQ